MNKYSKLRIVFAIIILFLGFKVAALGFSLNGLNQQLTPYFQRGLHGKIDKLENEYLQRGLKDGFNNDDFDKKLSLLKVNLLQVEKGESFSEAGKSLEKIVVFLCFLVGVLFFLNAFLALIRHSLLDVSIKFSLLSVLIFMILFFWYILNQMTLAFECVEVATQLHAMLKGVADIQVVNQNSMVMSVIFSPIGILFPSFILLFYCALPFGLNILIKKREQLAN